jgi:hypothetical protein
MVAHLPYVCVIILPKHPPGPVSSNAHPSDSISELLELCKFRRARQGLDPSTLTIGDGKDKKQRRKFDEGEDNVPHGGLRPSARCPRNLILSMISLLRPVFF